MKNKKREGKNMNENKGISLIVLVVTIIVMIIIAGAVIISLTDTKIIDRGEQAVKKHNQKSIEEAIILTYQELLVANLGKVRVEDLTQKIQELSNTYKEIQDVTAGNEKVSYTLNLTGKTYEVSTKTGTITERVESARVPFTNYIEDGPYYYVYKIDDNTERVITVSRESSKFNVYHIENKQEVVSQVSFSFEILDKLDAITRLGLRPEEAATILGISFDALSDDCLLYEDNGQMLNLCKSNYIEMIYADNWCTLDTSYEFPKE